jgi:hypothetical protein
MIVLTPIVMNSEHIDGTSGLIGLAVAIPRCSYTFQSMLYLDYIGRACKGVEVCQITLLTRMKKPVML